MPTADCALIDSHCHPHFPQFAGDIAGIRAAMREHEVAAALAVATTRAEFDAVLSLATDYPGEFYAALGVHPNNNEAISSDELVAACAAAQVLAVGETGLDYFREGGSEGGEGSSREAQRERFIAHIEAARQVQKPLIIHTRDSLEDTLDVLAAHGGMDIGGVFHCYAGGVEGVRRILDLGFHVSFTGIVAFKNADEVRAAAAFAPADRIMVETDAPYLAPPPHRGKTNTPGYVRYVARALAAARGVEEAQVVADSTAVFMRLFKPPATHASAAAGSAALQ